MGQRTGQRNNFRAHDRAPHTKTPDLDSQPRSGAFSTLKQSSRVDQIVAHDACGEAVPRPGENLKCSCRERREAEFPSRIHRNPRTRAPRAQGRGGKPQERRGVKRDLEPLEPPADDPRKPQTSHRDDRPTASPTGGSSASEPRCPRRAPRDESKELPNDDAQRRSRTRRGPDPHPR